MAAQSNLLLKGVATNDTLHRTFNFENLPVRTTSRNGQIWFVAGDVCAVLEIANPRHAVSRLDEDERGVLTVDTTGGEQEVVIINESGLYSLVMSSRKPEAKKFKKWVTAEVLPAIRQSGTYTHPTTLPPPAPAPVAQPLAYDKTKLAYGLAAQASAEVQRTVFEAVLSGDDGWKMDRWMLSLGYDRDGRMTIPQAKAIDRDAFVLTLEQLIKAVETDLVVKDSVLAKLAAACNKRLAQRIEHQELSRSKNLQTI